MDVMSRRRVPGLAFLSLGFGLLSGWGFLAACGREQPPEPSVATPATPARSVTEVIAPPVAPPPVDALEIVSLDGTTNPHSVTLVDPGTPRIFSRSLRTWIHEKPSRDSARLGYLRAGGSAPLAGPAENRGRCAQGWHPIKPRGYICLNSRATLDDSDPVVRTFAEHPPDFSRKLPYIYGTVRKPGPYFSRLPDSEELHRVEPDVTERMPRWLSAEGEIGASYAQHVWLAPGQDLTDPSEAWRSQLTADVPPILANGQPLPGFAGAPSADALKLGQLTSRVGHAFLQTFLYGGRRYGITTRLLVAPTDRYRPIQGSNFKGYEIGKDVRFPFALVRVPNARFRSGKEAPYRAAIELTGKQQFFQDKGQRRLHYETRGGEYISDRYASRLDPAKKMPGWGKNGEKWIDINLTKQTLMLYDGADPVYATLISSGEAGLSDPETSTATKRGIFRIHTKHVAATMSSREIGEEFELQDVPYVMYFDKEGYALHGAYWHDRFGIPRSHGCINLSPEDARRVFHWAEPKLPSGWHGVLKRNTGTVVFIHP